MLQKFSGSNLDFNKDNKDCLDMIRLINQQASLFKKYEDQFNLFKIFYHELVTYCTNYILIKNSSSIYNENINFPFLNSKYISNPKKIRFKKILKNDFLYDKFSFGIGKKKIFISNNFHLKKKVLLNIFSNKKIKFISSCFIDFPEFTIQLQKLKKIMKDLGIFLKVKSNNFENNFINYVLYILSNKNNDFKPTNSTLIVGTNMNLENRILSAKFMQNKSNKVISVNHSNYPFYVYKEPIRYVEYSMCTDYISYGKFKFSKKINNGIFSLPNFHYTSSYEFEKIEAPKKIKNLDIQKKQEYLYVPNMLNGNIRYGPFRDIDDNTYYRFQNELLKFFKNSKIKVHPNGKSLYFNENRKSANKIFEEMLDDYDVFIFDYFSTPFSRAIATNKPIIYFDIGLRNLEKDVLDIIKKRVYYFKVDLNVNLKKQFNNFIINLSSGNKKLINNFTNKFSKNNRNNDLNKIIEKLI